MNCVYLIQTPLGKYVGSTKNLKDRIARHKSSCRTGTDNFLLYNGNDFSKFIFTILEDNIEGSRRKKEQEFMDLIKPELNQYNAFGSKRTHAEYMTEVYLKKTYYCDCGSIILLQGRARHLRSQRHKDKLKEVADFIMSV